DCVSVCPKDALYVGWGAPAIVAKRRAGEGARSSRGSLASWALLAVFFAGSFVVFREFDRDMELAADPWLLIGVLTALSLAVAFLFRGKSRRVQEYSLAEQALLGGIFLLAMICFRGATLFRVGALPVGVPFLFALGLSGTTAYVAVQGLRLLYKKDVSMQAW